MTQLKAWCRHAGVLLALAGLPGMALAQQADPKEWQLNMGKGVTHTARMAYEAHMVALWVCVVIGVIVFGAMGYAMFK
ncbi:MAG: cytochrome c oxidase subunit II, partial [Stenotrophomonas chelatiphaga]